jgi:hypothetical protein
MGIFYRLACCGEPDAAAPHSRQDEPMVALAAFANDLAWPLAILVAWVAREFGNRWLGLSRISVYALAGFGLASTQAGLLPPASDARGRTRAADGEPERLRPDGGKPAGAAT